jgi:segregation and condensation protein B
MKIVTTPMCEEIVRLAGVTDYTVNKFPKREDGDLAILLSESKVEMNALPIKINTPSQVFESIRKVSKIAGNELADEDILTFFEDYKMAKKYLNSSFRRDVNVKVYSEFLKDIVSDVGFNIVSDNFDYVIFPDYLKDRVEEDENLVEIPSHNSISKNPFEKIETRYAILENLI